MQRTGPGHFVDTRPTRPEKTEKKTQRLLHVCMHAHSASRVFF